MIKQLKSLSLRRIVVVCMACCVAGIGLLAVPPIGRLFHPIKLQLLGRYTVEQRVEQYGSVARDRLQPQFDQAGITYPPATITLVGLKEERLLLVYAGESDSALTLIKSYPILAASGVAGPKLAEGDRQVPEGLYRIEGLNPNSRYHLSVKVNYPNAFDRKIAAIDGRTNLGGDIFIHGGAASVGCLAIGDNAIEELFVLLTETGIENVDIVLAPHDLRTGALPVASPQDDWRHALYTRIAKKLQQLPQDEVEQSSLR